MAAWIFVGAWLLLGCYLAFQQHAAFHTQLFDTGYYTQMLWNTAHGRWFTNSLKYPTFLADHLAPLLLLLAPLFWISPTSYPLQFAKIVALGTPRRRSCDPERSWRAPGRSPQDRALPWNQPRREPQLWVFDTQNQDIYPLTGEEFWSIINRLRSDPSAATLHDHDGYFVFQVDGTKIK